MDRKETTKFLGELLERQYLSGLGKHWAKEVNIDPGYSTTHRPDRLYVIPASGTA